MLKINNLKVAVEGQEILKGVDLEVKSGEIVAIMGKNGSGKSTLAYTLLGHPKYKIITNYELSITNEKTKKTGKIELDGEVIDDLETNERAEKGLFLANQYPVAVPGLMSTSFLWQIYKKRRDYHASLAMTNVVEFRKWLEKQAESLDLNLELLKRGLNDDFSGGEKKKMEILQMLVFNPKLIILDEIDSGLDVDALKKISQTVAKVAKENKIGVLAITHYNRILKFLEPDKVVVMEKGKIVKTGDKSLALEIEEKGFNG